MHGWINRSVRAEADWIAHMGIWCVKVDVQLFVRLQLFVPTTGSFGWRAEIASRSARRAAAKRLDLDASEHAIRLWWSGGCGRIAPSRQAISGSSRFSQSGFACQIKL